ncbi:Uncharacterised protein [Acinetobacter baumannii]|nr:Uncharacterised protein [Acinetobacter baumannii]
MPTGMNVKLTICSVSISKGIQCFVVSCYQLIGKVTRFVKNIQHVRQNIRRTCKTKRSKISNRNTYALYQKTGVLSVVTLTKTSCS